MAAVATCEDLALHRARVQSLLLRITGDEALADDLVQESLLRASQALDSFREEASFGTWLTAIALNQVRDHFRGAKRKPLHSPLDEASEIASGDHPEEQALKAEMSACILGHIERLPERQHEAVLLHHFAGFNHREIALQMCTSEGNARIILHRGLSALRTSLSNGCHLDFSSPFPCEQR